VAAASAVVASAGPTGPTGPTVVTGSTEATVVTGPTVVTEATGSAEPTTVTWTAAVPSGSALSTEVVMATAPVPVVTPTRVPKVTWTPLRKRAYLSLSLRRDTQTG
jgi:hypothetical protein